MAFVNIVTSDTGWILERLAREIEQRLPYVRYSPEVDPSAAVQYYITYSRFKKRVSPIEVAFFAHLEQNKETAEQFFQVARSVDHCVCLAELYADLIRKEGIEGVSTIAAGVDLDFFVPKVKIAVVGRTYHTGRKGEHLVAKVMDIPGIEWFFTGEGWPGPALKLPHERLPEFYRSMDYVLVPALYEGGPMCVIEALACGTPVIAPPIGWVGEFPHIEYKTGSAKDLRRVLLDVVAQKTKLRESVLDRTWDKWAEGHDRLFTTLMRQAGLTPGAAPSLAASAPRARSAQVLLHGSEGVTLGGPTVRVPRTAVELRRQGLPTQTLRFPDPAVGSADVIHGFNVWSPATALAMARRARWLNKPFVFSPIYLDLAQRSLWEEGLTAIFDGNTDPARIDALIASAAERWRSDVEGSGVVPEPVLGYHGLVREMVDSADHVIFLSEHERSLLARIGAVPRAASIVRNPVDSDAFAAADPELFSATTGIRDYVLCVARVETRKNQLMLIHALRDSNIPIVLVGHVSSRKYGDLIRKHAGPNVHFMDRLDPASPMLLSAYAGARVLVLPSWAEGAPLVSLEGGAIGASMVLSDRSGEREYFGDLARYCHPGSAESIRSSVLEAYESAWGEEQRERLKAHVRQKFSWERYTNDTLEVYNKAVAGFSPRSAGRLQRTPPAPAAESGIVDIVFDVTTSANHRGRWTGISRVEMALGHALAECPNVRVHFIAWADSARRFVSIPRDAFHPDHLGQYVSLSSMGREQEFNTPEGAYYIVGGSGWMQNPRYTEAITLFAAARRLVLTPILYDLIPVSHPFWFNDGYTPVFEKNLSLLLSASSRMLAISENTRRDVESFAASKNIHIPAVQTFRLGDSIEIPSGSPTEAEAGKIGEVQALLGDAPFVLSVGALHTRKNHKLLYDIWVRLAAQLGNKCPLLVLVGGIAWNGQDLARTIRSDARVKRFIHIIDDVDDRVLQWLYASCLFTVYPSLYEGWGLPVSESQRYGKICIASNNSSVPEIAPEITDLIDALDFSAWYQRILFYCGSAMARAGREEEIRAKYRPIEWMECAKSVVEALRAEVDLGGTPNLYTPGTLVRLGEIDTAVLYRALSWHLTESWGAWSSGPRASLRLVLNGPCVGGYSLTVRARALVASGSVFHCGVTVNGRPIGRLRFTAGSPRTFTLFVPADAVGDDRRFDLVFENERVQRVGDLTSAKTDNRRVGVGVEFISINDLGYRNDIVQYLDTRERAAARRVTGDFISLLTGDERAKVLEGEWTRTSWGMTATASSAALSIPLHHYPDEDALVECKLRAVASPKSPLSVFVMANGTLVSRLQITDDALATHQIRIPSDVRNKQQPLLLELAARNDRSPASLGLGVEARNFSLGLSEIRYGTERLFEERRESAYVDVPAYAPGRRMSFRAAAPGSKDLLAAAYVRSGWFPPERDGSWTMGEKGQLRLQLLEPLQGSAVVEIALRGFATAKLGPTEVKLVINGHTVVTEELGSDAWQNCVAMVRADAFAGARYLLIEIVASRAQSPFSFGGKDDRVLGVQVGSLRLAQAVPYVLGTALDLGDKAVAVHALMENWNPIEPAGAWSKNGKAAFWVSVDIGAQQKVEARLLAVIRVVQATPEAPVPVHVTINGRVHGVVTLASPEFTCVDLPVMLEGEAAILKVEFEQPLAASPQSMGLGEDKRVLGVLVRSLAVAPADSVSEVCASMAGIESVGSVYSFVAAEDGSVDLPEPIQTPVLAGGGFSLRPMFRWSGAELRTYFVPAAPDITGFAAEPLAGEPAPAPAGTAGADAEPAAGAQQVVGIEIAEPVDEAPAASRIGTVGLGEVVTFASDARIHPLLRGAWHGAEDDGIWSSGAPASFTVQLPEEASDGVRLNVTARVYGTSLSGGAAVYVSVNGEAATAWYFEEDGFCSNELLIPASVLEQGRTVEIQLERPDAKSPAELEGNGNTDARTLGVKISEFVVVAAEEQLSLQAAQEEADASYEKVYGKPDEEPVAGAELPTIMVAESGAQPQPELHPEPETQPEPESGLQSEPEPQALEGAADPAAASPELNGHEIPVQSPVADIDPLAAAAEPEQISFGESQVGGHAVDGDTALMAEEPGSDAAPASIEEALVESAPETHDAAGDEGRLSGGPQP
jgi:glycosyltransferase involved in cell wall biosynthesis